jgi:hypothetical protein
MPTDHPNKQDVMPKRRVVDLIERTQEDAMCKLRQSGIPEVHVLLVMQRITSLCLQTLQELDLTYRQFEEIVAEGGRSEANQTWLNNKAAAMLLQVESAIATLVAEAIATTLHDHKTQPPPPEPVIEVQRARPAPPVWWPVFLALLRHLVWVAGMAASLVFSYQGSGSIVWAGIVLLFPFLLWVRLRSAWWALIFPVIALGLEAWVLYWLSVVEG